MEPNSTDPINQDIVTAGSLATGPQSQPTPPEQTQPPAMAPADVWLCNVGGRAVAWFVFVLGAASALGSAWVVYLAVRWLWFGGMTQELTK